MDKQTMGGPKEEVP